MRLWRFTPPKDLGLFFFFFPQTDSTLVSSMPSRAPLVFQRVLPKPLRLTGGTQSSLMSLHPLDLHKTLIAILCSHKPCKCHDGDIQTLHHQPNAGGNQGASQGAFLQCQAMPLPLSSPVLKPFSLPSELPSARRGGFLRRSAPRPVSLGGFQCSMDFT